MKSPTLHSAWFNRPLPFVRIPNRPIPNTLSAPHLVIPFLSKYTHTPALNKINSTICLPCLPHPPPQFFPMPFQDNINVQSDHEHLQRLQFEKIVQVPGIVLAPETIRQRDVRKSTELIEAV